MQSRDRTRYQRRAVMFAYLVIIFHVGAIDEFVSVHSSALVDPQTTEVNRGLDTLGRGEEQALKSKIFCELPRVFDSGILSTVSEIGETKSSRIPI